MARRARDDNSPRIDDGIVGTESGGNGTDGAPATDDSVGAGGTADSGTEWTNPAATGAGDGNDLGGEPGKRKRGRPKGSGAKTQKASAIGADGVAGILVALHSGLAVISRCPELELSEDEADKFAKASIGVAKLYSVEVSEKAVAWTNLIGVAASIYGTRLFAIGARVKHTKATQRENVVVPFPPTM